jgi:hypothetical protein
VKFCSQTTATLSILLSLLLRLGWTYTQPIASPKALFWDLVGFSGHDVAQRLSQLWLFHGWMHKSAWAFIHIHKEHHSIKKSCQAFLAFRFTILDLLIENAAPTLYLLLVKAMLGMPFQVKLASIILLGIQHIGIHSCNPHTVYFFNPLLDHWFKVNLQHALHHAVQHSAHEDVTVVPWEHFHSARRQRAISQYERVFELDLGYKEQHSEAVHKKTQCAAADA